MIQHYNRASIICGLSGFILYFALPGLFGPLKWFAGDLFAIIILIASPILMFLGVFYYVKAKGHSGLWALWILAGVIGIIVMACLVDKTKAAAPDRKLSYGVIYLVLAVTLILIFLLNFSSTGVFSLFYESYSEFIEGK